MPAPVEISTAQLDYLQSQGVSAELARAQAARGIDPCKILIGPARSVCESLTGGVGRETPSLPNPFEIPGDLLGVAQQTLSFVVKAAGWIANPDNWIRILKVAIGAGLILSGLIILARPAVEPVLDAVPAGKLAKAAVS